MSNDDLYEVAKTAGPRTVFHTREEMDAAWKCVAAIPDLLNEVEHMDEQLLVSMRTTNDVHDELNKVKRERDRVLDVAALLTRQRDSLLRGTKPVKSIEATLRAKCGDVLDEVQMFAVVEALTGATSLAGVIDSSVECPADPPDRHPKCQQSEYPCGHHSQHTWGTPTDSRCTFCGGDS